MRMAVVSAVTVANSDPLRAEKFVPIDTELAGSFQENTKLVGLVVRTWLLSLFC